MELAHALEEAFDFVRDADTLPDKIHVLEKQIIRLLETTQDCCRFLQNYLSKTFASEISWKFSL